MLYESMAISFPHLSYQSLNPYSNGICSMREKLNVVISGCFTGLNPYSNGICSMSAVLAENAEKVWQS